MFVLNAQMELFLKHLFERSCIFYAKNNEDGLRIAFSALNEALGFILIASAFAVCVNKNNSPTPAQRLAWPTHSVST